MKVVTRRKITKSIKANVQLVTFIAQFILICDTFQAFKGKKPFTYQIASTVFLS